MVDEKSFEPTYKELKLSFAIISNLSIIIVSSLPIRN